MIDSYRKAYYGLVNFLSQTRDIPQDNTFRECMETAVNALAYRIERPAKYENTNSGRCPKCKSVVSKSSKYCRFCGQALEWRDGLWLF